MGMTEAMMNWPVYQRGAVVGAGVVLAAGGLASCTAYTPGVVAPTAPNAVSTTNPVVAPPATPAEKPASFAGIEFKRTESNKGPAALGLKTVLLAIGCKSVTTGDVLDDPTWSDVYTFQINYNKKHANFIPNTQDGVAHSVGDKTKAALTQYATVDKLKDCGAYPAAGPQALPQSPFTPDTHSANQASTLAGCGSNLGPAIVGTVCPDGSVPIPDTALPYGCPSSRKSGIGAVTINCPERPGQPAGTYRGGKLIVRTA